MGVFGLSVLVVVIVGGLDSVLGRLVGWVAHWPGGGAGRAYLGGEYKLLATFIVLVCVLMLRPYGLFGTREIERLLRAHSPCVSEPSRKATSPTRRC